MNLPPAERDISHLFLFSYLKQSSQRRQIPWYSLIKLLQRKKIASNWQKTIGRHPSTSPLKVEKEYSKRRNELFSTTALHLKNRVHFRCRDSLIFIFGQLLNSFLSHVTVILSSCQPFLERYVQPPEKTKQNWVRNDMFWIKWRILIKTSHDQTWETLVSSSLAAKLCGLGWARAQSVSWSVWYDFLGLDERIKNASLLTSIFLLKKSLCNLFGTFYKLFCSVLTAQYEMI